MTRPLIAALLSALAFPGAGHIYLQRLRRGAIFIIPSLLALFYILQRTWAVADMLSARIVDGSLPVDIGAITRAVMHQAAVQPPLVGVACWIIIVCWIGSMIDTWLICRAPGTTNNTETP